MASDVAIDEITRRVHEYFVAGDQLDLDDVSVLRDQVQQHGPLLSDREVGVIVSRIEQQLFGLGVLEPLLKDPTVTEVMVNGPGVVWVERSARLEPTAVQIDRAGVNMIIERILAPLGLRVDRTAPYVDARLSDGSRVNIAVAPLALDGPYITIRRFRTIPLNLDAFCSSDVAAMLRQAVHDRCSMIISGGTGSGKTSLLNALCEHLRAHERVITIEDAAELRLPGDHTVRLEARPANAEGVGQITIRSLVRNALRMRPDRIIVGEVRGAEALDMVQAMNTGHDGSMSTCHANSPLDALRRLEAMTLMSDVGLPLEVVRDHLESAVDLIVHVDRLATGARRVSSVYRCGDDAGWLVKDGARCGH